MCDAEEAEEERPPSSSTICAGQKPHRFRGEPAALASGSGWLDHRVRRLWVKATSPTTSNNSLHVVAECWYAEVCEMLLSHGAVVDR